MNVYVVTHRYPYSDTDCVSVYQNMDAVMHKMEIIRLHGMDELEEIIDKIIVKQFQLIIRR